MYYSAGTYEAFAHTEKPKDVDKKSAYIIGTGLAGLTAAFYLVRDGQMKGEHIHLLEKLEEHVLIAVLSVGKISRVHHAKPCYHIRILLYKLAVFAFGHILHAFTSLHILKRRGRQKGFIQNKKISPHE